MGLRQRIWARDARARLVRLLGGKCARCGVTHPLQFDCIMPCGDAHHKVGFAQRISFYRRQQAAGNLQLLCTDCHIVKTAEDLALECAQPF